MQCLRRAVSVFLLFHSDALFSGNDVFGRFVIARHPRVLRLSVFFSSARPGATATSLKRQRPAEGGVGFSATIENLFSVAGARAPSRPSRPRKE